MPFEKTPQAIILEHNHDIEARSDVDEDDPGAVEKFLDSMEDWGDGFYVDPEPVLVQRGPQGEIVRTTPLSELPGIRGVGGRRTEQEDAPPVIGRTRIEPTPLNAADRDKLVAILAARLFRWYANQPPKVDAYNPIYDGLPDVPPGSPQNLQPLPGTNLYPATPGQIMEWLKVNVIGPRVRIQNKRRGLEGYQPEMTISRKPLR